MLCAGQATIDHVLTVEARLSPGHKHLADRHEVVGGGVAANAAVTVARLGGHAVLLSRVGSDPDGDAVLDELRVEGVDVRLIDRADGTRTPMSAVIVGPDGERTIVNHTPASLLSGPAPAVGCFDATLVDGRWPEATADVLRRARERGVPGIVDVDRRTVGDGLDTALELASHLVFGEDALRQSTGCADHVDGLRRIAASTDAHVAVTVGAGGVVWLDDAGARQLGAFEVDVVDTTGAGDVYHGAFAVALAEGSDEPTAHRFAAAAAAIKCERPGARRGIPTRAEVDDLIARQPLEWSAP